MFDIKVKIYYKDTDAGGVVYYSRYAEFMEMARTELLRSLGYSVKRLDKEDNILCIQCSRRHSPKKL